MHDSGSCAGIEQPAGDVHAFTGYRDPFQDFFALARGERIEIFDISEVSTSLDVAYNVTKETREDLVDKSVEWCGYLKAESVANVPSALDRASGGEGTSGLGEICRRMVVQRCCWQVSAGGGGHGTKPGAFHNIITVRGLAADLGAIRAEGG